jgi:probable F420-dependent oxidoreductase
MAGVPDAMRLGVALGNLGLAMEGSIDPVAHARLVYDVAGAAERLGFHSVWAGDHLALPKEPTTPYPYGDGAFLAADASILDPFAVLAALAGRTRRIGLGFGVLVAPYRHPLVTAKLIASIDALSSGRVIVGVGTGWMPEEFAAVGVDVHDRGADTDACLRFWRRAFADGEVDGLTVLPTPVQRPQPPIWVGGQSAAAIRRTVAFGTVWDAPYVDPPELRRGIGQLRAACRAAGRDPASIGVSVRGIAAADVDEGLLDAYADLGVDHVGVMLPVQDRGLAVAELERLAARVPDQLSG